MASGCPQCADPSSWFASMAVRTSLRACRGPSVLHVVGGFLSFSACWQFDALLLAAVYGLLRCTGETDVSTTAGFGVRIREHPGWLPSGPHLLRWWRSLASPHAGGLRVAHDWGLQRCPVSARLFSPPGSRVLRSSAGVCAWLCQLPHLRSVHAARSAAGSRLA